MKSFYNTLFDRALSSIVSHLSIDTVIPHADRWQDIPIQRHGCMIRVRDELVHIIDLAHPEKTARECVEVYLDFEAKYGADLQSILERYKLIF